MYTPGEYLQREVLPGLFGRVCRGGGRYKGKGVRGGSILLPYCMYTYVFRIPPRTFKLNHNEKLVAVHKSLLHTLPSVPFLRFLPSSSSLSTPLFLPFLPSSSLSKEGRKRRLLEEEKKEKESGWRRRRWSGLYEEMESLQNFP